MSPRCKTWEQVKLIRYCSVDKIETSSWYYSGQVSGQVHAVGKKNDAGKGRAASMQRLIGALFLRAENTQVIDVPRLPCCFYLKCHALSEWSFCHDIESGLLRQSSRFQEPHGVEVAGEFSYCIIESGNKVWKSKHNIKNNMNFKFIK